MVTSFLCVTRVCNVGSGRISANWLAELDTGGGEAAPFKGAKEEKQK